jgi:hypothetical protein
MSDPLTNDQLRAISPFLVKDTDVLLLTESRQIQRAKITQSTEDFTNFSNNATAWEKKNCPIITGNNEWTPIIDEGGVIIAYTSIQNNTGIFYLWFRDIDGDVLASRSIAEKPLEQDEIGNFLAATIVTLGGAAVLKGLAAGITAVASSSIATAGARVLSLALSRLVAGETTEGVILTALRSIRAQSIVKALEARGVAVVVNIGGESGVEEVAKFGVDQIALNPQVRFSIAKRVVSNLVKEDGEKIGEVFAPQSINKIVSRRLDQGFNTTKVAQGAFRVLKPGGQVEMELFAPNSTFVDLFKTSLQNAGFKNVAFENGVFKALR